MRRQEIVPNELTYTSLIAACKRQNASEMLEDLRAEMALKPMGAPKRSESGGRKGFQVSKELEKRRLQPKRGTWGVFWAFSSIFGEVFNGFRLDVH